MFTSPRYVFKNGDLVAERGTVKAVSSGSIHTVKPQFDAGIERKLADYFARYQTMSLASFKVSNDEVLECGRARDLIVHPCRPLS
jgi:formylmethanofuran dehydrogenase subunit A